VCNPQQLQHDRNLQEQRDHEYAMQLQAEEEHAVISQLTPTSDFAGGSGQSAA